MADMMKIALLFTGVNLKGNLFGSLLSNMDKVSTKMGKVNRAGRALFVCVGGLSGFFRLFGRQIAGQAVSTSRKPIV